MAALQDLVRVIEVSEAEFYIGSLFRRRLGGEPPNYPRHFIAFYHHLDGYIPLGYIHYTVFEDMVLCGGMVIDDRLYRRLLPAHRQLIRTNGGIAELMLRETFSRLTAAPAIWGYVGDKQSKVVCLRAGFVETYHAHILAVWNRDLSAPEKEERLAKVIALGPF
jgi:hypothetical protein